MMKAMACPSRCFFLCLFRSTRRVTREHPRVEPRDRLGRHAQAELGPAPDHVFGAARVLPVHEPLHLACGERRPEILAKTFRSARITEDLPGLAAVGAHEAERP